MAYEQVNAAWPAGTRDGRDIKPSPEEALSAAKRLYRIAMKRPFKGAVKLTSGRNYTWVRSGVLYVNPDQNGGGWHEIVHALSHFAVRRLHPTARDHGPQHAFIERMLIEEVVKRGWLDGKLKPKVKPLVSPAALRAERARRALARLMTRRKRIETAIRKRQRQVRYYEKTLGREAEG